MSFSAIPRGPVSHAPLIWIVARNRDTGAPETMGLWTGSSDRTFTVEGEVRSYKGAGQILDIPPIQSRMGPYVQMQTIGLAAASPEVAQAIRGYDSKAAPVEIHVARFDPETDALLGIDRAFKGGIDTVSIETPAKGEPGGAVTAELASAARDLTRPLTHKISDESQRQRSGDRFLRYADIAGMVERWWGTKRVGG